MQQTHNSLIWTSKALFYVSHWTSFHPVLQVPSHPKAGWFWSQSPVHWDDQEYYQPVTNHLPASIKSWSNSNQAMISQGAMLIAGNRKVGFLQWLANKSQDIHHFVEKWLHNVVLCRQRKKLLMLLSSTLRFTCLIVHHNIILQLTNNQFTAQSAKNICIARISICPCYWPNIALLQFISSLTITEFGAIAATRCFLGFSFWLQSFLFATTSFRQMSSL